MQIPISYLFVPGNRPERFDKAVRTDADAVIIDLEDAVPVHAKDQARTQLHAWLQNTSQAVIVRINSYDTPWFNDDLLACAHPMVSAIMVPKAQAVEQLTACAKAAPQAQLLPLIETAIGFASLKEIASAPHVARLAFGSIDFQLDLGIDDENEGLLFFRSRLVYLSKLYELAAPIDGVSVEINDSDRVRADAERSKRLGFGAKLCIHPAQIAAIHAGFCPTQKELLWARRIIERCEGGQEDTYMLDGKMIDKPVISRARALVKQARSQ
ncbi:CoA ester lyase [Alcaligenes sp. 13f]|uniref:HpcH/HpaI aldolase/citrate lyase family protein n=1 Tax=Alcaligenes sp. 13f TaxID=2841924 RepID=UPI001CF671AD|nr:CoA ester lyase [Alcaligenes sp. 13f]MCB4321980.1 CoA ester lyase [Alcaligenes sp. 13f]